MCVYIYVNQFALKPWDGASEQNKVYGKPETAEINSSNNRMRTLKTRSSPVTQAEQVGSTVCKTKSIRKNELVSVPEQHPNGGIQ